MSDQTLLHEVIKMQGCNFELTVICNKNRRIGHGIVLKHAHCGIKERVALRISNIWSHGVLSSSTVLPNDDATSHHILMPFLVWYCISWISRIRRISCKIDSLAVHCRVLSTEGTIESLLKNFVNHFCIRSMP